MDNIDYFSLEGLERIGGGGRSDIYRLSDSRVLKAFHGEVSLAEIRTMVRNSQAAAAAGLPTPMVYQAVRTDSGLGIILNYVPGTLLAEKMHGHPESFHRYAHAFASLSCQLAQTRIDSADMNCTNDFYIGALDRLADVFSEEEIGVYKAVVDAVPRRDSVVHGDFHVRNVIVDSDDALSMIDMDDFSCGHPIWDVASLAMAYYVNPQRQSSERLLQFSGLNPEEAAMLWQDFTDVYFADLPAEERKRRIEASVLYAYVRRLRMAADLFEYDARTSSDLNEENMHRMLLTLSENRNLMTNVFTSWR